jgi:hypothetical protein
MTTHKRDEFMEGILHEIVFNWMEENGVASLQCEFHGEGDSGSFEPGVSVVPLQGHTPYDSMVWSKLYDLIQTHVISPAPIGFKPGVTMAEFVHELSEKIEETTNHGVDWHNNDGGQGNVTWILDGHGEDGNHYKRGICLTVSARIIEYETTHFSVRNLDVVEEAEVTEQ